MTAARIILWPVVVYTAAQLISNISSLKIGIVASYAVDMGVFLFPLTFTLRDVMHQAVGKTMSVQVILLTAACNLFLSAYMCFIGMFPASSESLQSSTFDTVMDPIWRLVFFSIIAQVVSELIDTGIYQKFTNHFGQKHKWGRVVVSNSVSIPVDNLIFCIGAFSVTLPWLVVWEIFLFNLVIKYTVSFLSIPMIYIIRKDSSSS